MVSQLFSVKKLVKTITFNIKRRIRFKMAAGHDVNTKKYNKMPCHKILARFTVERTINNGWSNRVETVFVIEANIQNYLSKLIHYKKRSNGVIQLFNHLYFTTIVYTFHIIEVFVLSLSHLVFHKTNTLIFLICCCLLIFYNS